MARECIPGCDPSDCQCSAAPAGDDLRAIVRSFLAPDGPHERVLRDDIWPICGACGERWPCATVREEGR